MDFISHQVIGPGIFLDAKSKAVGKLVAKKMERLQIDQRLRQSSSELFGYGVSIWKKFSSPGNSLSKIRVVPLESIEQVQRDDDGDWLRLKQTGYYGGDTVEAGRLIVFKDPIDHWTGFGRGIMQPLMTARTVKYARYNADGSKISGSERIIRVPPMIDILAMVDYETMNIFQNFGAPQFGVGPKDSTQELDKDTVDAITTSLRKKEAFASRKAFAFDEPDIDPRARFVDFLDDLRDKFAYATRAPLMTLFTQPGWTQASSREARRLFDRTIVNQQRLFRRELESEVVFATLKDNGIIKRDAEPGDDDIPEEAAVKIHFGPSDKAEITLQALTLLIEAGVIFPPEARDWLREMNMELDNKFDPLAEERAKNPMPGSDATLRFNPGRRDRDPTVPREGTHVE